ncbi:MFS transporter [Marinilabilia salmonicolor]|nr:MFS transporter [Marinilabilia salmonicolor]
MSNQIASAKRGSTQLVALAILGMMFFSIGFALGINSYLIPLLKSELSISSAESYLVLAATFSAFLIFGYPASFVIARIGYKKTMALSFLLFSIGFYLYIPSGQMESLPLFLAASFLSGMGNTFLQATVNPYVTILGPIDSAAQRMSIMGILNKLAWPVAPLFLALVIGKSVDQVTFSDTTLPFYIIIGVFLLLG